jgi:hypothetical protein
MSRSNEGVFLLKYREQPAASSCPRCSLRAIAAWSAVMRAFFALNIASFLASDQGFSNRALLFAFVLFNSIHPIQDQASQVSKTCEVWWWLMAVCTVLCYHIKMSGKSTPMVRITIRHPKPSK